MLSGQAKEIRRILKENPNWSLAITGPQLMDLAALNSDILNITINYVEGSSIKSRKIVDPKYKDPVVLYKKLREHKRVPRCKAMEENLKKK